MVYALLVYFVWQILLKFLIVSIHTLNGIRIGGVPYASTCSNQMNQIKLGAVFFLGGTSGSGARSPICALVFFYLLQPNESNQAWCSVFLGDTSGSGARDPVLNPGSGENFFLFKLASII